jgi:hypothetical protein
MYIKQKQLLYYPMIVGWTHMFFGYMTDTHPLWDKTQMRTMKFD